MYNGIINIYKEKGYTSHDVVAKLRGILKQKKIGHTGTLDPDATGVLPVCLGSGTKLCDMITDRTKIYETVLLLGQSTDTQDISGKIIEQYEGDIPLRQTVSDDDICQAVLSFIGDYDQIPPMYSALKVNGKKLYELAREGKEIDRKPRRIHIFSIDIQKIDFPKIMLRIECSKGTYIRTLCHDIGEKLGVYGCMAELTRIKSGPFRIDEALKLDDIQKLVADGEIEKHLIPNEKMFEEYPVITMTEQGDKILYNGNPLHHDIIRQGSEVKPENGCFVRVHDSKGIFKAVYVYDSQKQIYKTSKMFL
ncbi:MAG: tRNA pseudouridine(55) synthase TruB [Lachnospiraceae bacterium]|nr:tRNA pseudouridine(55) synthase TruB [Lachnospiraceae bacterium]